jgi:hypothetical protein
MSGQISRLTLVSHILYDREVLELRQENQRLLKDIAGLKLNLFQQEHDVFRLTIAMCTFHSRHPNTENGILNVWIEPMLQKCGLEVVNVGVPYRGLLQNELDTHLVCTSPFTFVAYGTKLWKAKSIDDPELLKLKALFDALAV